MPDKNRAAYDWVEFDQSPRPIPEKPKTPLSLRDFQIDSAVVLNESDPFELAMADIVRMFRKKNADYARTGSRWSNFEDMSRFLGDEDKPWLSSLVLCQQKLSRIGALVSAGKEPTNESLIDSLLDNAVYAAMALAMARES